MTEPPRLLLALRRVVVLYVAARVARVIGGADAQDPSGLEAIADRRLSRLTARAARAYGWRSPSAGVCE